MARLAELVGGIVMLVIFFFGVRYALQLLEPRERDHERVQHEDRDPPDAPKG